MSQATQVQEKIRGQVEAEDKSVLRWGGIAGMMGGSLFILSAVALVASSFSTAPSDPAALIAKFPDIRANVAVAETLDLLAVISWTFLFLAMFRALRQRSPVPALFGSAVSIIGLAMLFVGALTYVAFDSISSLYNASGATAATQATLTLAWQATQGVFNETDTVGFLLMSIGFIILGAGMVKASAFGKGFGGASLVLGAAGVVGISLYSVTSSTFGLFGILVFVVLPILVGWEVFRLSKVL